MGAFGNGAAMRVSLEAKLQSQWKLEVGTRRSWRILAWRSLWTWVRCSWWTQTCVVNGLWLNVLGGLSIGVVVLEVSVAGGLGIWLADRFNIGAVGVLGHGIAVKLWPVVVPVLSVGVVGLEAGVTLEGGFVEPMGLRFTVVVVHVAGVIVCVLGGLGLVVVVLELSVVVGLGVGVDGACMLDVVDTLVLLS